MSSPVGDHTRELDGSELDVVQQVIRDAYHRVDVIHHGLDRAVVFLELVQVCAGGRCRGLHDGTYARDSVWSRIVGGGVYQRGWATLCGWRRQAVHFLCLQYSVSSRGVCALWRLFSVM